VVDILEQLAVLHKEPVEQIMIKLCSYIPDPFQETCVDFIKKYGSIIIDGFVHFQNVPSSLSLIDILHTLQTHRVLCRPMIFAGQLDSVMVPIRTSAA